MVLLFLPFYIGILRVCFEDALYISELFHSHESLWKESRNLFVLVTLLLSLILFDLFQPFELLLRLLITITMGIVLLNFPVSYLFHWRGLVPETVLHNVIISLSNSLTQDLIAILSLTSTSLVNSGTHFLYNIFPNCFDLRTSKRRVPGHGL